MILSTRGTPFVGTASLNSGSLTTTIPVRVTRNTVTPFTLGPADRVCITNVIVSTNDTTLTALVSITDTAPTNATTLWRAYVTASGSVPYAIASASFAPGVLVGWPGAALTVTASPSITATKTIEITINGIIYTGN